MVDSLGDQHTSYFTKEELKSFEEDISGEYAGVGMVVGKKDKILSVVSPIEDTPAYKAGMRTNDYILEIDGKSTVDLSIEECVKLLKGKPNTTVKIVVAREGVKKPFDVILTRAIIKLKYVKQKMVQGNIGYVRLTQFGEGVTADVRKAVDELVNSGAKGIILDLRNNPGGTLLDAVGISSIFIDSVKNQEGKIEKAVIVSTKDKKGKVEVFRSVASENNKAYTDLPMVIMINEGSASASEIVSGAIKDHKRGILLGEKSYGKGSVQQMIPLKDGDGIKMTIAKYYTPSGVCIDHKGIEPDVKVEEEEDYALYEGMVTNVVEEKQEKSVTESAVTTTGAVAKNTKAKKDDKQLNTAIGILKGLIIYGRK
jgi:carboxyl-terminal processing protease